MLLNVAAVSAGAAAVPAVAAVTAALAAPGVTASVAASSVAAAVIAAAVVAAVAAVVVAPVVAAPVAGLADVATVAAAVAAIAAVDAVAAVAPVAAVVCRATSRSQTSVPCLHYSKRNNNKFQHKSQNELGPLRGPRSFWDPAISTGSVSLVFVRWRALSLMISRGSYLGTFSQVHLGRAKNFKNM